MDSTTTRRLDSAGIGVEAIAAGVMRTRYKLGRRWSRCSNSQRFDPTDRNDLSLHNRTQAPKQHAREIDTLTRPYVSLLRWCTRLSRWGMTTGAPQVRGNAGPRLPQTGGAPVLT